MITTVSSWSSRIWLNRFPLFAIVALIGYFGIFVLPYAFPTSTPVASASYVAGFNNRVAAVVAAFLSLTVFLISTKDSGPLNWLETSTQARIPRAYLWATLGGFLVFESALAACVYASPYAYGEEAYGLDRFYQIAGLHRTPPIDFEFAYGPILLYIPLLIKILGSPFQLSLEASYLVAVVLMHLIGIVLLYYVVNRALPGLYLKITVFLLFSLFTMNVDMGLQYTGLRFFGPYAVLLAVSQLHKIWHAALFLAASGLVLMLISPEIGVAFSCGAAGYCLLRGRKDGWEWLACAVVPFIGIFIEYLAFGPSMFRAVSAVAAGAFNFVVVPVPHIVLFLACIVFIVPMGLAAFWRKGKPETSLFYSLCGIYITSIVLIPSAFGRCDAGHVLYGGFGFFLLAFLFVGRTSRNLKVSSIVVFATTYLVEDYAHFRMYARQLAYSAESGIEAYLAPDLAARVGRPLRQRLQSYGPGLISIDPQVLASVAQHGPIAMPFLLDNRSEYIVKQRANYQPNFFAGLNFVGSAKEEDIVIREVDRAEWVVMPCAVEFLSQNIEVVRRIFPFPLYYPQKRSEYIAGLRIDKHIVDNWPKVRELGTNCLYRNPSFIEHP